MTTINLRQIDEKVVSDLKNLAHTLVRNEILAEHFLAKSGASPDEIGAMARELDERLKNDTTLRGRFPALFA
jgi:hypothetical protein